MALSPAQKWIVFLIVYGLFLAVGIVAILAITGAINVVPAFETWAVGVLVVDICAAAITVFRQTFEKDAPLPVVDPPVHPGEGKAIHRVSIVFRGVEGIRVALDRDHCTYEIRNTLNQPKAKGPCVVRRIGKSWEAEFDYPLLPADWIRLRLIDKDAKAWEVADFRMNEHREEAVREEIQDADDR